MESIAEAPLTAQVTPGLLPRFQDGAVNLQELLRQLAEPIVNEIMDAEADQMCGEGNSRNGYRKRKLLTCVGTLTPGVPKLRQGSFFPEDVLTRYQRVDGALVAAVAETCTTGTSTRKVQKIAQKLGIDRLSRDQVGAMYHLACEMPGGCCPKAARVLEGAEPAALAYPDFPKSHWKRLRTNNVRERTNREIKRRSRVVQAFSLGRVPHAARGGRDVRAGRRVVRVALLLRGEDFRALRGDTQNRTADQGRGRGAHARIRASHQGEPRACGQDGGGIGYRRDSGF